MLAKALVAAVVVIAVIIGFALPVPGAGDTEQAHSQIPTISFG